MSIIRIEKNKNYSVIANAVLRDSSISARAKGIYAYIMTLPDDWKLHKVHLHKQFKEGRDAIDTAFAELEEHGIIKKFPRQNADGTLNGWDYTIYEHPTVSLETRETVSPVDGKAVTTKYLEEVNTNSTENTTSVKKVNRGLVAWVMARWRAKCGGSASYGRVGRAVKSLDSYTEEEIRLAWNNYERETEPKYMSVEGFASKIAAWMPRRSIHIKEVSDDDFLKGAV